MNILSFHISLLVALQIISTVGIIVSYAFFSSMQEKTSEHESYCEITLLASLVLAHHPRMKTIEDLTEATEKEISDPKCLVYWLAPKIRALNEKGTLPDLRSAPTSTLGDHLLLAMSPVMSVACLYDILSDSQRYPAWRIAHTSSRKDYVSKLILLAGVNAALVLVAVELLQHHYRITGSSIAVIAGVGILANIVSLFSLLRYQHKWKAFWQGMLMEIMASAAKEKNHDLFNRAQLQKASVDRQPDAPIPGGLAFYGAVYSFVQIVLYWLFHVA